MSADHYLSGPCEGMSLHREGKLLTLKDTSGREPQTTYNCDDEHHASESLWRWRDILYARYELKQKSA